MLFRRRREQTRSPTRGLGWKAHETLALRKLGTLNEAQRSLIAFGWLRTEVNNGGFSQYFFNASGDSAPDALAAAAVMGATDVATLLGRAMALLGDPYPLGQAARQERLEEFDDDDAEPFETLDQDYYQLEAQADLDAAMDEFVRLHRGDLGV